MESNLLENKFSAVDTNLNVIASLETLLPNSFEVIVIQKELFKTLNSGIV